MQIVTLEFEGIGPFTGRHRIDFRSLGAGGLFLLEGPTGAGKTTIIDALVFALYGDVAGSDSSKGRLVSTKLPAGVEPFVDVTLETNAGLYRVRRVPQHQRRKTRGTGLTVGKAAIQLWKLPDLDGEGVQLSTSMQDANEELQRAIGLTKEQFTQTVVLPQGQFATFLRAKPDERRAVLQDIFGTEFYERMARQLIDLAGRYRQADREARAAVGRAAASLADVAWADAAERDAFAGLIADAEHERALDLAGGRVVELTQAADAAHDRAEFAAAAAREAHDVLSAAQSRNQLVLEHSRLVAALAELDARADAVAEADRRRAEAERAEHLRAPIAAQVRARRDLDGGAAEVARLTRDVASGDDADLLDDCLVDGVLVPQPLEAAGLAAREQRSALAALVEIELRLGSQAQHLELDRQRHRAAEVDLGRLRETAATDRARAQQLAGEVEQAMTVAEGRADAVVREAEAKTLWQAVLRQEALAAEFVQATRAERAARQTAVEASERHLAARASWLGSLAGTLAEELTEGAACPVCGSVEHPAPATLPPGAVTRVEVERLEQAARQAEQQAASARTASDAKATEMHDQQAALGDVTRAEAELGLQRATEQLRVADEASRRVTRLQREIAKLTEGAARREAKRLETETHLAADEARLTARAEGLERDRTRVAEALGGYPSVADRSAALGRRADVAERLAQVLAEQSRRQSELERRTADLTAALVERAFPDADAARAALLSEPERSRLATEVAEHRERRASVRAQLAEARFADVGDEVTDLTEPQRVAAQARATRDAALTEAGAAARTAALAAEASERLGAEIAALASVIDEAEPYLQLADLAAAGPGNLASVNLPTFVLLRRFEEVVDLANVRLGAMTGGRYSLRRTDAREGRAHKLGLGLEVVDHASGDATRDPKTLSGGETFQASLAMALGLADAVTAEAGGIELSTLFVDEGFGSLDPDALDMVMAQLTALRDGGRSVGVVSHVAEMKQRIAERITVIPRRDGTSTLVCSTDPQPALVG